MISEEAAGVVEHSQHLKAVYRTVDCYRDIPPRLRSEETRILVHIYTVLYGMISGLEGSTHLCR